MRRGTRLRRPTWKVRENQLAEVTHQEPPSELMDTTPPASGSPPTQPPSHQPLRSVLDRFGLSRIYPVKPSSIPGPRPVFEDGAMSEPEPTPAPVPPKRRRLKDILKPYPNLSSFLFDHQFWTSSGSKSRNDRNALRDVIVREDFDPSDLKGVNFEGIEKDLRQTGGSGWRETLLTIRVLKGIKLTKRSKRAAAAENPSCSVVNHRQQPSNGRFLGPRSRFKTFSIRRFATSFARLLLQIPLHTPSTTIHMNSGGRRLDRILMSEYMVNCIIHKRGSTRTQRFSPSRWTLPKPIEKFLEPSRPS